MLVKGLQGLEFPRVLDWGVQAVVFLVPGGLGGVGGGSPSVKIDLVTALER